MKLRRILIRNWGPLNLLDLKLSSGLTVIYGKNEMGKTSIMEAVLLSLAGSPKEIFPYLRKDERFTGACSIEIDLPNGRVVRREYPSKRKASDKVERIRLLFSWPGEAYQPGLAKDLVTGLLLPQEILSWNPIKGLGIDGIREGRLVGFQRGKYREYTRLKEELKAIQREEDRFYSLSLTEVLKLEDRIRDLDKRLSEVLLAKKIRARFLYQRLDEIEKALSALPEDKIQRVLAVRETVERFVALRQGLEDRLKGMISQQEFLWWKSLLSQRKTDFKVVGGILLIGIGIGLLVLSFLSGWLRWIGLLMVAGVIMFFLQWVSEKMVLRRVHRLTGKSFLSWGQLEDFIRELEKEREQAKAIEVQISELRSEEERERAKLMRWIGEGDVDVFLREYQEKRKFLERQRKELLEELSRLGVKREEAMDVLLSDDVEYSEKEEMTLRAEIERLRQELERRRAENEGFLSSLAVRFGLSGWTIKELFVALKKEKQGLEEELKNMVIEFVGAIAWTRVLDNLRVDQHKEVSRVLNEERFGDYLRLFSGGRFCPRKIEVQEEDVLFWMQDGTEYAFSLLSAGVRHQVLFAFKSALLEKIYPEGRFIILDDTFLFSDRDRLKDGLSNLRRLVEKNWQIIYLTSDDRTRDILARFGADVICLEE